MSNYTKTTNFAGKDSLPPGNVNKVVKGTEIDTEFDNIAIAVATKGDAPTGAVVGTTDTQTLTNKTIDADLNTITNIENADIKAGAAIDPSKLAAGIDAAKLSTGTVSNAEFDTLNGVSSGIQAQLDTKPTKTANETISGAYTFSGQATFLSGNILVSPSGTSVTPNRDLVVYGTTESYVACQTGNTGSTITDGLVAGLDGASKAFFINYEAADMAFYTNALQEMYLDSSNRGLVVGAPTGAGKGVGTVNAQELYANGNRNTRTVMFGDGAYETVISTSTATGAYTPVSNTTLVNNNAIAGIFWIRAYTASGSSATTDRAYAYISMKSTAEAGLYFYQATSRSSCSVAGQSVNDTDTATAIIKLDSNSSFDYYTYLSAIGGGTAFFDIFLVGYVTYA